MNRFGQTAAAVLLALTLLLTGCGTQTAADTTAADTAADDELIEIKNGLDLPGYYYENNLTDKAADPFILYADDTYYLYCTGGSRFSVRQTKYLNAWPSESKTILTLSTLGWAREKGWAPEVYAYNGKYYMIFSAQGYNCAEKIM